MTRPDYGLFMSQRDRVKSDAAAERMWWKLTTALDGALALFVGQAVVRSFGA